MDCMEDPREAWDPWQADEYLLFLIMDNQPTHEMSEALRIALPKASRIQTAA